MSRTYVESVLPSGRGIRLEKLSTKQFRQVLIKAGDKSSVELSHQMLLVSLRAVTPMALEWQMMEEKDPKTEKPKQVANIDKMLEPVPEASWQKLTYEQLIADDYIDDLLAEPTDYTAALNLAAQAAGLGGKVGSVMGKFRLSSGTL